MSCTHSHTLHTSAPPSFTIVSSLCESPRPNHQSRPVQYKHIEGLIDAITSRFPELFVPSRARHRSAVSPFCFTFFFFTHDREVMFPSSPSGGEIRDAVMLPRGFLFCQLSAPSTYPCLMLSSNASNTSYVTDTLTEGGIILPRLLFIVLLFFSHRCPSLLQRGVCNRATQLSAGYGSLSCVYVLF